MQLSRWNMWRDNSMKLSRRIQTVVEGALGLGETVDPIAHCTKHPGLVHFHVHLMEMAGTDASGAKNVAGHALVNRALPSAGAKII